MVRRFAFGEYFTPNNPFHTNDEAAGARTHFIEIVQTVSPAFLRQLRDRVYPQYAALASDSTGYWRPGWRFDTWQTLSDRENRFTPTLRAWAIGFHLDETWVLEGALQTLSLWHRSPSLRESLPLYGFRFPRGGRQLIGDGEVAFEFADSFGWLPQYETWLAYRQKARKRFEQALADYENRVRALAEARGAVPASRLFRPESFEWLARSQCCGWTLERILGTAPMVEDKTTISKGMHKAARLIGVRVRPKASKLKSH